jgi:hypothetical protein
MPASITLPRQPPPPTLPSLSAGRLVVDVLRVSTMDGNHVMTMTSSPMSWNLVNPEGAARPTSLRPAPRPTDLDGKTIGLAWNGKPGGEEALEEIARLLGQHIRGVQFIRYWQDVPESVAPRELSPDTIQAMAAHAPDVVIVCQAD